MAWARSGIGSLLAGSSSTVHVELGGAAEVPRSVAPYGPGDVTALDERAVVRTVPRAGAMDFEPNLFPSLELAHPALPWLLSPPPDSHGRVTPWIVLIVVEDRPGVTLAAGPGTTRVLTIEGPASPADELPDLAHAWAWAHGQTTGATGAALDAHGFAHSNGEARGRLLAARRLAPGKSYLACAVPAFAAGVTAALGEPPRTGPAWTRTETTIRLPVYHTWRFGTGPGGDFASLAKLVKPHVLGDSVGHRTIDISDPGWGMPRTAGAQIEVSGALRSVWLPPALPEAAGAIGDAIAQQIDAAADPSSMAIPALPPPCYGAAATQKPAVATAPTWQRALNHDVAQRAAAGLGAAVVRANLDTLVDAAWRNAGEAERANATIRHAELAAEITQLLAHKHVGAIDDDGEALAVARPLLARMHARPDLVARDARAPVVGVTPQAGPTLAAAIRTSAMPDAALTASLRRIGRPYGPIARAVPSLPVRTGALLAQVDARSIVPVPPKLLAASAAGFDAVSRDEHERPRLHLATSDAVGAAAAHWRTQMRARRAARALAPAASLARRPNVPPGEIETTPVPVSETPDLDPVEIDEFAAAAAAHQHYVVGKLETISDRPRPPLGNPKLARPLAAVRALVEAQWTPARGVVPLLGARLRDVQGAMIGATPAFRPLRITPVLDQPLVHALQALSPEHVMPGVGGLDTNRAALASTAPEVVRAFLVGANDELGRELLWRGFPGALGHTWLQTFWGRTVLDASGAPVRVPDIPPIETWPDAGAAPSPATLVLVVRAEVLHRYPSALVYAVAARWVGKHRVVGGGAPLVPVIAATLGSDIALFGFDLDVATARGSNAPGGPPGWYFVLAEHPSEPRFGLAASPAAAPSGWQQIAWSDVAPTDIAGNYLRSDGPLAARSFPGDPLRWGSDAAALAAITRRRAIRVAMHASTLLPPV